MSGVTNERIPFIVEGKVCDWDGEMKTGLKNSLEKVFQEGVEKFKDSEVSDGFSVKWELFWPIVVDGVVDGLKKCDEKLLKNWEVIYDHSYNMKNNRKKVIARDATINQQTAALAGGIPAAGALGVGAIPFCKFCLKFFSK